MLVVQHSHADELRIPPGARRRAGGSTIRGVNLSAYLTSLARTAVPSLWGAAISWAIYAGILPPELQAQAEAFASVLVAVIIAIYYGLVRLLESQAWWPAWLSTVLLGAPVVPVYRTQTAPEVTGR